MANLPPYSTYRTDSKQMMFPQATSHGNTLSFVLPGSKQQLNVKFPDSRLAVCEKCKKNFKTRDMCRVRNNHTAPPWTTAYICVTIDDSCLDENGKYTDKPLTVRMVQWQPYCVKKPFGGSKTPVCAACKRTNRTRSFCRERHKHRLLPWCTVYVLLSSLDAADPSTVVADPSSLVDDKETSDVVKEEKKRPTREEEETEEQEKPSAEEKAGEDETPKELEQQEDEKNSRDDQTVLTINSDNGDPGDDINDIAESRTFLVKLSCRGISVHWLELSEYDSSENAPFPGQMQTETQQFVSGMGIPGMDPNMTYFNHNASYAAQQHQNALQSRQQYFFQMQQQQQQFGKRQEWASFAPNGPQPGDHGAEVAGHPPAAWGLYYAPAGVMPQAITLAGMNQADTRGATAWGGGAQQCLLGESPSERRAGGETTAHLKLTRLCKVKTKTFANMHFTGLLIYVTVKL